MVPQEESGGGGVGSAESVAECVHGDDEGGGEPDESALVAFVAVVPCRSLLGVTGVSGPVKFSTSRSVAETNGNPRS